MISRYPQADVKRTENSGTATPLVSPSLLLSLAASGGAETAAGIISSILQCSMDDCLLCLGAG